MNINEYKDIYVFCEITNDNFNISGLELLGEARRLIESRPKLGYKVIAVVIGDIENDKLDNLGHHGADKIIYVKSPKLAVYNTNIYTSVIDDIINDYKPDIFLIPGTVLGRDLAPRVAARCDTGLTADATLLEFEPEKDDSSLLYVTRPAFGGNLFGTIVNETKRPQMTTIRPGVMDVMKLDKSRDFEIIKRDVDESKLTDDIKILEVSTKDFKGIDISKADIIIAGGRGVGDNFDVLKECADLLDAEVGASRAPVDEGLADKNIQVGQTGKTVKPRVYIACGISGAVQHLAGMEKSDYIIAINKDKNAPIFGVANLGIVGDAVEILPLLSEEIIRYKRKPE